MADALLGGIVINEILVDPNGANNFDTDGSGTAASVDEYIELYNSSNSTIDISGLQLWDQGVGNWFTFPSSPPTLLVPGAHALVMSGVQSGGALPTGAPDDLFFDAGRGAPLINNGGDNVVLYDPGADEYIIARFNGDALDTPATTYSGFSATATQVGAGEDFGNDNDGFSIQRQGDGADTFVNNETPTPGTSNICVTYGTLIATPRGDVLVQDLQQGDLINTLDNGPQPILWSFCNRRSACEIAQDSKQGAVRLARGTLGNGLPRKSLIVSRQHRMLVRSTIAQRMFGDTDVFVHAKDMLGLSGVTPAPVYGGFAFYHLLLPQHEVIFANGAATESLYFGPGTIASLAASARTDLANAQTLTPALPHHTPARPFAKGSKARQMIQRHLRNGRAVFSPELQAA
jgi:hypothetical protein